MTDRLYPKPGFHALEVPWRRQVEQGFSSFFAKIFGIGMYLMIFKVDYETLNNHQKCKKKKIEEKPCFTCFKPIFRLNSGARKSNFG